MEFTHTQWLEYLETSIADAINARLPRFWREDSISEAILLSLTREKEPQVLCDLGDHYQLAWDAFKLSGNAEQRAGDIAVLVRLSFSPREAIEGVAYLEAKKIHRMHRVYDQLDRQQLSRQLCFSQAHRTLLYSDTPIQGHESNLYGQLFAGEASLYPFYQLRALCIPSQHLLATHGHSVLLHRYGLPLSYILASRYIKGMELDYRTEAIELAKGFIGGQDRGGVAYLLVVHVSLSADMEPDPLRAFNLSERYQRLQQRGEDEGQVALALG